MLSQDAKLLLSKHPEICKEIAMEFYCMAIDRESFSTSETDWQKLLKTNQPNNCPHCGIATDGSSNEQCYKAPKKDYEILKFKLSDGKIDDRSQHLHSTNETWWLKDGCEIISVRRLSDGEVFAVRDKIEEYGTISGFEILGDNSLHVVCGYVPERQFRPHLSNIQKSKSVLFVTHDGVNVFEGDDVWQVSVLEGSWGAHKTKARKEITPVPSYFKYFSTEEKAEEYILLNKPCLSYSDIDAILKGVPTDATSTTIRIALGAVAKQKSTHAN